MSDIKKTIKELLAIDGAMHTAVVDSESGMILGDSGGDFDMEVAAAGNSQVVKVKLDTMKSLGLEEEIEDILITIQSQYHIIRPVASEKGLFIYLVLDKNKASLALARRKILKIEQELVL